MRFIRHYINPWVTSTLVLFLGCLTLTIFSNCSTESSIDYDSISIELPFKRFDKAMFSMDTASLETETANLKQEFPSFYPLFTQKIMNFKVPNLPPQQAEILGFKEMLTVKRSFYDTVQAHFPSTNQLESDFNRAFKAYRHYFPNRRIPDLIIHVSEFGPAAATLDSTLLGVNLDLFLGADFDYYSTIGFPRYLSRRFEPEYIVPNSLRAYLQAQFEKDERKGQLIDEMVYQGKLLYALDKLLPQTANELKIGYTKSDILWCENSEPEIWAYFIENNLLYNSNHKVYSKLVSEAPTTSGMPKESPGRVGVWIGWQIVKAYMEKHPKTSLAKLMSIESGQEILTGSRYKPKR